MNKNPSHNFDRIAFGYDTLASCVFGQSIKKAQLASIHYIPDGANVLIMGGGTGWYLKELLCRKKLKKILYIEASQKMLVLTQKTIERIIHTHPTPVELRFGTEESILPDEQFDIVITHFFLDIFAPARLQSIVIRLNQALHPHGLWLIADFRQPVQNKTWAYQGKQMLIKTMYLFFRVVCQISAKALPDVRAIFSTLNMHAVYECSFYRGLIFSSVYTRKE